MSNGYRPVLWKVVWITGFLLIFSSDIPEDGNREQHGEELDEIPDNTVREWTNQLSSPHGVGGDLTFPLYRIRGGGGS